jgi:plastocyanin
MSLLRVIAPLAPFAGRPGNRLAALVLDTRSLLAATLAAMAALSPFEARAADWTLRVVDANGAPVPGAVAAVELKGQPAPPANGATAVMGQRDRQFQPQLLAIQTGTVVTFPNFDTVRHHVYSFSPTKKFELKLYSGTPAEPVVFDKAGVAQLGCNIHDRMSAHIVVVDTPLFGITDASGEVRLDLPPGSHRLRLWAARLGNAAPTTQPLMVGTGAPGVLKVELRD